MTLSNEGGAICPAETVFVTAHGPTSTVTSCETIYDTLTETTTVAAGTVTVTAAAAEPAAPVPYGTDASGQSPIPPQSQPGYTITETVTAVGAISQTPTLGESGSPSTPCTPIVTEFASSRAVEYPSVPVASQLSSSTGRAPAQSAPSPYGGSGGQGTLNILTYTLPSGPSSPGFTGVITLSPNSVPYGSPATSPATSYVSIIETASAQQPEVITVTALSETSPTTPCESSTPAAVAPEVATITETENAGPTYAPTPSPCESTSASPNGQTPSPYKSASIPGHSGQSIPSVITITHFSPTSESASAYPAPSAYGGESGPSVITVTESSPTYEPYAMPPAPYGPDNQSPAVSVSPYGTGTSFEDTSTLQLTQTITVEDYSGSWSWVPSPTAYNGGDTSEVSPVYEPTPTSPYESYPAGASPDCESSTSSAGYGSPVIVYTINSYGSPVPAATFTSEPKSPGVVFTSILSYGASSAQVGPSVYGSPSETYVIPAYGASTATEASYEAEITILYTVPSENGNQGAILTITADLPVPGTSSIGVGPGEGGGLPTTTLCGSEQTSSAGAFSPSESFTISTAPGLVSLPPGAPFSTPCPVGLGQNPGGTLSGAGPQAGGSLSTPYPSSPSGVASSKAEWTTLWPLPTTLSTSCTTTGSSYVFQSPSVSTAAPFANTTVPIVPLPSIPITISIIGPSVTSASPAEPITASIIPSPSGTNVTAGINKIRGMRY
jgi:hypothetical protein